MGCTQARPKTLQQRLIDEDLKLHFNSLSVLKIKQAFGPLLDRKETISYRQFKNAISQLGVTYKLEEDRMIKKFLSTFFSFEEESVVYYDLQQLLVVMFLLADDSQQNKAGALFDLYDEDDMGLSKRQMEQAIREIVDLVQAYTKNLLEVNEVRIGIQERVSRTKREALMPQVINWFNPGIERLTKEKFLEEVKMTAKSRGFIDLTSPQSIRNAFIYFQILTRETNIELQVMPSMSLQSSRTSSLASVPKESEEREVREKFPIDFDTNMAG